MVFKKKDNVNFDLNILVPSSTYIHKISDKKLKEIRGWFNSVYGGSGIKTFHIKISKAVLDVFGNDYIEYYENYDDNIIDVGLDGRGRPGMYFSSCYFVDKYCKKLLIGVPGMSKFIRRVKITDPRTSASECVYKLEFNSREDITTFLTLIKMYKDKLRKLDI